MSHIIYKAICGSRQEGFDHYQPVSSLRDIYLGCLNPSVVLSLEDFQFLKKNVSYTPSYDLRLLTTISKHINTGIKFLSL